MISRRCLLKSATALSTLTATQRLLASEKPFTISDVLGREVIFQKRPEHFVVANYIANFLMVGGAESVAKITALPMDGWDVTRQAEYTRFTEAFPLLKSLPSIGGYHDNLLNTERILALKPDILLVGVSQFHENAQRLAIVEKAGIAVVVLDYHAMTVKNHCLSTEILGVLLGRESIAQAQIDRYRSVRQEIAKRLAKAPAKQTRRRVYVECGNEGVHTYGNSYNNTILWGGILSSLKADNIAAGMKSPYGALSREFVVSKNPQTIIIAGSIWQNAAQNDQMRMGMMVTKDEAMTRLRGYARRPLWERLQAVRTKEVYGVDHGSLRSMFDYVYSMYLAKILYPGIFDDFDVESEITRFFKTYLPEVDTSGTYIVKLT